MEALLIVDLQNDFLPGGSLSVPNGNSIVEIINNLLPYFNLIVATKDWHPKNHKSFASFHKKKPGEIIDLKGVQQILWPDHCIQETLGSEFSSTLKSEKITKIIYKGTDPNIDSYSAFFDNKKLKKTDLDAYLKSKNIDTLYVVGLATEYCVLYSVLDALDLGYNVKVIVDACRGLDINKGDVKKAEAHMLLKGAEILSSTRVKEKFTNT